MVIVVFIHDRVTYRIDRDDCGLFFAFDSEGHRSRLCKTLAEALRELANFTEYNNG
jgi:hypothetical protein